MRVAVRLLLCPLVMAGCAGKPSAPPPFATTYVSPGGNTLAAAPTSADGTLDTKALAVAKRAGYTLVNTNGEVLYCRTDLKIGTHIQRSTDTTCLTAQEMTERQDRTRQSLQQFHPSHLCGGTAGGC
jgi:hypothetical protein